MEGGDRDVYTIWCVRLRTLGSGDQVFQVNVVIVEFGMPRLGERRFWTSCFIPY